MTSEDESKALSKSIQILMISKFCIAVDTKEESDVNKLALYCKASIDITNHCSIHLSSLYHHFTSIERTFIIGPLFPLHSYSDSFFSFFASIKQTDDPPQVPFQKSYRWTLCMFVIPSFVHVVPI